MTRRFLSLLLALLLLTCHALGQVTFTSIDVPGAKQTEAFGINSAGDVVGAYHLGMPGHGWHPFMLHQGQLQYLPDYPGAGSTYPLGINDAGVIVGYYYRDNIYHGYIYDGHAFKSLQYPNTLLYSTFPYAISNNGQVVGFAIGNAPTQNFVWRAGKFTPVNIPGSYSPITLGINDSGVIVGQIFDGGTNDYAFYISDGQLQVFNYPGHQGYTSARGISDNGIIVGSYFTLGVGNETGFAELNGNFVSLTFPGAHYTYAQGVNISGQVVGTYTYPFDLNTAHAFITSPIF